MNAHGRSKALTPQRQGREGRLTSVPTLRVWDRFVRLFHWALVASFFTAWATTEHIGLLHKAAGYVALGLVAMRLVWGFVGSRHARFAAFVPSPRALRTYLRAWLRGQEPRCAGHNPLGALMILFLLAAVTVIGVSGWMLTLDAFWGSEIVENLHEAAVDLTLLAVCIHVLANIVGGFRHRENLILSMITGRKPVVTSERPTDDLRNQADAS
jgi:cytochrome b